jgi:tRNA-dihydrouridine synthase C
MLHFDTPALILAPMDGITDAPMRALQGEIGSFSFAVSEFVRVSVDPLPARAILRDVPELATGSLTPTGLPVQVQILGGDPDRMALSAFNACRAGAKAIDINFGCPAPTVNRNDGGATLLNHPCRIRDIVAAVRAAVPREIPVSAKIRLGWDSIDAVYENSAMAAEGGASWLTIHARTRLQGYSPPVYWKPIGVVREALGIPVVANGDIWSLDDFLRCRDQTGCNHFMIGRGALARPSLSYEIARELGIPAREPVTDWIPLLRALLGWTERCGIRIGPKGVQRLKQWLNLAQRHGDFTGFERVKRIDAVDDFFAALQEELAKAA